MKFAIMCLQLATTFLENGFKFLTIISFMMIQYLIYDNVHLKRQKIIKIIH